MSLLRICSFNSTCLMKNGLLFESTITAFSRTAGSTTREDKKPLRKEKTPQGKFDMDDKDTESTDAYKTLGKIKCVNLLCIREEFPGDLNPYTKEKGGPAGPEPTRYGDWERKGRCIDF